MAASAKRASNAKSANRDLVENIKLKTKEVLQNRKKLNNILEIQAFLEGTENDSPVVIASCRALEKIFCHAIRLDYLKISSDASASEKQACEWLRERLREYRQSLLTLFSDSKNQVQEAALISYMNILQAEGQHPFENTEKSYYFPLKSLQNMVEVLLSSENDNQALLVRFEEFLDYHDVLFHVLRALATILKEKDPKAESQDLFLKNLFHVLEHIVLEDPSNPSKKEQDHSPKQFCGNEGSESVFKINYGQAKKYFSAIWQQVLNFKLNPSLYKRVLILMPEKVMPHLEKPLLVTDFLMESYNIGGAVSLLALHGVFVLIQKHNLDYPEFYTKLYALLDPGLLHVKYRARFFYLCDIFMSSTHIPEYVVAAFAKKLARLALIAPPNVAILVLRFVGNLAVRHKGLARLMHDADDQKGLLDDPYNIDEPNPSLCKAVDSSLWEIKTLQSHVLPEVASAAKFINNQLPKMEWDISEYLELNMEEMLEKETKRKIPDNVPMNYEKPSKLACVRDEKLSDYFELF